MHVSKDLTTERQRAFRKANQRQNELVRAGVSQSGHERNCCFLNTGAGRFANISAVAGLDHIGDGRAYALVDWDHDGDLDLWATNRTAPRAQFLRNSASRAHHFVGVKLVGNGTTTNRDAIGARVELVLRSSNSAIGTPKSIKTVRAGEGFLAQSSKSIHFGIGTASEVDHLIVRWPGGGVEKFDGIDANRYYTIAQGSGKAIPWTRPSGKVELLDSPFRNRQSGEATRIPLRYHIPLSELPYVTLGGQRRAFRPQAGGPTLVNLWASWCQPCLRELVEFGKQEEELRDHGLQVIALSVDQLAKDGVSNPAAARAFLDRQALPFRTGFATNDLIAKLETTLYYLFDFARPWSVPTSFLLDRQGHLAVIYIGPVEVGALLADVEQLALNDFAWLEASLPFEGRWTDSVRHPNLTSLITTYFDRDLVADGFAMVDKYADVLVSDPDASQLLTRLATTLADEGHVVKAQRRFRQAIEADSQNAIAHLQYGKLLVQRQHFDDAISECREALRLRPNYVEAHFFLANLLNSRGDKENALVHFQRTVALEPTLLKARFALGNAFASQLQWQAASEQFRVAAQLDPKDATVQHQLARVLQKGGHFEEAIGHYRRALQLRPGAAGVHYSLGAALAARGETVEAIANLRRSNELEPGSLLFSNGYAWIVATRESTSVQDRAEALELAAAGAKETQYGHPQILDTLAAAHAAVGEYSQAVNVAERAIDRARAAKKSDLANEIRARLKLYRAGKPYREGP